jgi:D-alanyl-D-alanine carboxypeptidase/D-alanyl-D-alanine-endopeptidase (penicillin-binding protein 4)
MNRFLLIVSCFFLMHTGTVSQSLTQNLQKAFARFEADSQMKYGIASLYVVDAETGQVVFDKNSRIGLAPASTQKIITSVTAFELLGKEYKYKTEFGYIGKIKNKVLQGDFFISPSGDPTFGSWRWESTADTGILNTMSENIRKLNINGYNGFFIEDKWQSESIPDGWIWQDIGNYYGAGAASFNWRENQFDVFLQSGQKTGDAVKVTGTEPHSFVPVVSNIKSAARGSGDNAYVYYQLNDIKAIIRGTIPVNENAFAISASNPFTADQFKTVFNSILMPKLNMKQVHNEDHLHDTTIIYTHYSPSLDSIIYWFNKKSINLYGEALIKTLAYEKNGFGSTYSGIVVLKNFWKEKGMDEDELGVVDGSGLSPINRVTTHSQVEILKFARNKDWFPYFYNSLPEYNGMRLKSGTIRGVKGYSGYHKAKNGKEYIISFLVNNYNGSPSSLVSKMYRVLDVLK